MKRISEVIAQLEAIKAEYGDLRVLSCSEDDERGVAFFDVDNLCVKPVEQSFCPFGQSFYDEMFSNVGTHQRGIEGDYEVLDQSQKPESFMAVVID